MITCPNCFDIFAMEDSPYRCVNPKCSAQVKNDRLSKFLGRQCFGRIIPPTAALKRRGRAIRCPEQNCGIPTGTRVCPSCHSDLPRDIDKIRNLFVGVHGDVGSGKSVAIAVLIHHLKANILPQLHSRLSIECAHCEENYSTHYEAPLFQYNQLPPPTELDDDILLQPIICRTEIASHVPFFSGLPWKRKCNVAIYDAPGEASQRQDTFNTCCKSVGASDGLIVLIDPLALPQVRAKCGSDIEPSRPRQSSNPVNVIERLARAYAQIKGRQVVPTPTAFVVTKSDELQKLWNFDAFNHEVDYEKGLDLGECESRSTEIKTWLASNGGAEILDKANDWFPQHCFFAISSLGGRPAFSQDRAHGQQLTIGSIQPKRVEEPLLWLLAQHGIVPL